MQSLNFRKMNIDNEAENERINELMVANGCVHCTVQVVEKKRFRWWTVNGIRVF